MILRLGLSANEYKQVKPMEYNIVAIKLREIVNIEANNIKQALKIACGQTEDTEEVVALHRNGLLYPGEKEASIKYHANVAGYRTITIHAESMKDLSNEVDNWLCDDEVIYSISSEEAITHGHDLIVGKRLGGDD